MISWILKLMKKFKTMLTLQQQLLICFFILLTIICLLIYVATTIITNIIGSILINSSTIMYEKSTQKMISNYNNLQSHLFQTYLSINDNHLIGMQQLFLQKDHLEMDLPIINQKEEFSRKSYACYTNLSFYNESDQLQKNDTIFFEFLSRLENFMDFTNKTTYFGYGLDLPNIYLTYPCTFETLPSKTVWQQKISEINLSSYFSYQSILQEPQQIILEKSLQFTQMLPLIDNQRQIQGLLAANTLYNFQNLKSKLNNIEVHILIVKYDGKILFQDIVKSPLEYIFDYEVSGISYDDWLYMIRHDNHDKNTCFSTIPQWQLCLKNSILQKEYLIYPQNHFNQRFYSFILVNNNAFFEYQRVENIIKKGIIEQIFLVMLYNIISVIILSLILLYALNKKIFKPLQKMGKIRIDQNISHFKEIIQLQSFKNENMLKNPLIEQLIDKYLKLTQRIQNQVFKKDRICKIIENFKFPQKGTIDSANILCIIRSKIKNTKDKIQGNLFQTKLFETTDQSQKVESTRLIRMVSIESQRKYQI